MFVPQNLLEYLEDLVEKHREESVKKDMRQQNAGEDVSTIREDINPKVLHIRYADCLLVPPIISNVSWKEFCDIYEIPSREKLDAFAKRASLRVVDKLEKRNEGNKKEPKA